jgi:hypothetical protein
MNPALGAISCLNFESEACMQGHYGGPELNVFLLSMRMLCLTSDCELKFLI